MTRHTRRRFVKSGGLALGASLAGCLDFDSLGGESASPSPPPSGLRDVAYYFVNNAGSRTNPDADGPVWIHGYRSREPLRKETDVGGLVRVHPVDAGVECRIDLTDRDGFGEAGVVSGKRSLADIDSLHVEFDGQLRVGVQLGLEYADGTIYEWEQLDGHTKRQRGLDGDQAVLTGRYSDSPVTIGRDDAVFEDPKTGAVQSLADRVDQHGDVPARVVPSISGGSSRFSGEGRSFTTTLTAFEVREA